MQKRFQFNISLLFLVSYGAAICLAKDLGQWTVLFLLQPLMIWVVVSVLQHGIPKRIVIASQENEYRLDGSKSSRRASREQKKWREVRFALYTISIAATFSIDWLIVFLNSDLIVATWLSNGKLLVILGSVTWVVCTLLFVQYAYLRILSDFYRGVRSRKNDYVNSDLGRLQS